MKFINIFTITLNIRIFTEKKTGEINFNETILILTKNFSDKISLFNTCCQCLNLVKGEHFKSNSFFKKCYKCGKIGHKSTH